MSIEYNTEIYLNKINNNYNIVTTKIHFVQIIKGNYLCYRFNIFVKFLIFIFKEYL